MTKPIISTRKKAELIIQNKIYIPNNFKPPYPLDRSTAGPGAETHNIALNFDNKNIKLAVSRNQNEPFSLEKENEHFQILKEGKRFLKNVKIIPTLYHAPEQAFINIENRCIYNCAFCNLTNKQGFLQQYNESKFIELILKASKRPDFKAIALTSGAYPNNKTIIKNMYTIVINVRKKIPNIPIGVEPCVTEKKEIISLKKAGADEIKINLQIPDENPFNKICPQLNYKNTFKMLNEAVKIFGEGKVTSNLIYGLGESDDTIIQTTEQLAEIGVVPTLRKIRINEKNRKKIETVLSSKIPKTTVDRVLELAIKQKKILKQNGLITKTFNTMCHKCGCCDIVPFWDI